MLQRENEVSDCSERLHSGRNGRSKVSQRQQGRRDVEKADNGKANCFALLRWITNLKCVKSEVKSSAVTLNRVASSGSMAPCRSHHGYYTRQNWIFEEIHQELNPVTCKLVKKTKIPRWISRPIEGTLKLQSSRSPRSEKYNHRRRRFSKIPMIRLWKPCNLVVSSAFGSWLSWSPFSEIDIETAGTSRWSAWIP